MAFSSPLLREFVRKVFRDYKKAGTSPTAILDAAADAALTVKQKGRLLTGSTDSMGIEATWSVLGAMRSFDQQVELIDAARTAIGSTEDLDTALASIVSVRRSGVSFARHGLYCGG